MMIFLAVFFKGFDKNTKAITPTGDSFGEYAGTSTIIKADLPELENKVLTLKYTGEEQPVNDINNMYENSGTVYYKTGENKIWSTEIPKFKDIGSYIIYYYVIGDKNHNNLGSQNNPIEITVNMEVSKDDWGTKIEENGIVNYVTDNGTTNAEVNKNGVIWIREESYGTSAWYGLDNTSGIFAPGSRFWVRWLHSEDDKEEFDTYYAKLDDAHKQRAEEQRLWIFLTGVTAPDGTEYTNLDVNIPYYIQLGDDWDEEDVYALFISETADEPVSVEFGSVAHFNEQFENINFPVTSSRYARLLLRHFSPYAVYDEAIDHNKKSEDINTDDIIDLNVDTTTTPSNIIKTGINDTQKIYLIIIFMISLIIIISNLKSISYICDRYLDNKNKNKIIKISAIKSRYIRYIMREIITNLIFSKCKLYLYRCSLGKKLVIKLNFIRLILYQQAQKYKIQKNFV